MSECGWFSLPRGAPDSPLRGMRFIPHPVGRTLELDDLADEKGAKQ